MLSPRLLEQKLSFLWHGNKWNGIFKYLLDGAELVETLKSWTGAALNSVGAETGQWIFHGANVILGLVALRFWGWR